MRRGLAFVSSILVLLGLELSTEAVSLVLHRLGAGFSALVAGVDFHVSGLRFVAGLFGLAAGLVLWALLSWSAYERRTVTAVGDACPLCGNTTKRVRRREWQRLLAVLIGERTTRRKCPACGWVGLSLKH